MSIEKHLAGLDIVNRQVAVIDQLEKQVADLQRQLAECQKEYNSAIRMHDACHEEEDRGNADEPNWAQERKELRQQLAECQREKEDWHQANTTNIEIQKRFQSERDSLRALLWIALPWIYPSTHPLRHRILAALAPQPAESEKEKKL